MTCMRLLRAAGKSVPPSFCQAICGTGCPTAAHSKRAIAPARMVKSMGIFVNEGSTKEKLVIPKWINETYFSYIEQHFLNTLLGPKNAREAHNLNLSVASKEKGRKLWSMWDGLDQNLISANSLLHDLSIVPWNKSILFTSCEEKINVFPSYYIDFVRITSNWVCCLVFFYTMVQHNGARCKTEWWSWK